MIMVRDADRRPRILVVDDDPVQRLALGLFLRDAYAAVVCATAAEAELEAKLQRPDIIISDIHMPDDDGLAFRARLVREPELGSVPFLFLTSDRSPGASAAANETGIDDLLYKPLDKRKLLGVVDRILKRQQQLHRLHRHASAASAPALPCPALPDRVGRYQIAQHPHAAGDCAGTLLWHRAVPDGLQILLCSARGLDEAGRRRAAATLGFIKGVARGIDAASEPATFVESLFRLADDDGLRAGTALTALFCQLRADGAVALAEAGAKRPILIGADSVRAVEPGTDSLVLAPGERLVLAASDSAEAAPGAASVAEMPPGLAFRPPSVIAETLARRHPVRSRGHAAEGGMLCVIAFD
jgi:sigma-B regulation protein RsbU (phosphoserine phosphatase)